MPGTPVAAQRQVPPTSARVKADPAPQDQPRVQGIAARAVPGGPLSDPLSEPPRRSWSTWRGILGGLALGSVWAMACASSDQMIEARSRASDGARPCRSGAVESCYAGPRGTADRGECRAGQRKCIDRTWSPCEGEQRPQEERCNGKDDNCDGIVDNGFEREGALCFYEGAQGACRTQGAWHCAADGLKSECNAPRVRPQTEVCDGIDNDCDGVVDNDAVPADQLACKTGRPGVCAEGTNRCIRGTIKCISNEAPGVEVCNGRDDNCNGVIDDDCVEPASVGRAFGTDATPTFG